MTLSRTGYVTFLSVPITPPNTANHNIEWIPQAVENLLHNHDIMTRNELAKVLGVARSTVYGAFAEDWTGEPSIKMLAQMAGYFRVPIGSLVTEPGRKAAKRESRRVNVRRIA
ncbi:Cro protein [Mycobacterium phage DuncansLeg]|nr:Cro protein [Mycobacterium phage MiniLon]QOP66514.1 Cro protein [Mycobacterium phage MiniMac]UVF61216.1 Cro protein [Mycobacterium phage DuncansLeg]